MSNNYYYYSYKGQHRRDDVGSLRWSDEACLIAERMEQVIADRIIERSEYDGTGLTYWKTVVDRKSD